MSFKKLLYYVWLIHIGWNHIDAMDALRQGIHLRSYGQINPLHEYQSEGFEMFNRLIERIEDDVTRYILRAEIRQNLQREEVAKPTATNSGKEEKKTSSHS